MLRMVVRAGCGLVAGQAAAGAISLSAFVTGTLANIARAERDALQHVPELLRTWSVCG